MRRNKPVINHYLADGRKVNSIAGRVIPADNAIYKIILASKLAKGD